MDLSWTWRKLIKIRLVFKSNLHYKLGNGESFNLWLDTWINNQSLVEIYSHRVIYDSGLSRNAKVIEATKDGCWDWKGSFATMEDIRARTCFIHFSNQDDFVSWNKPRQSFTIKAALEAIRPYNNRVEWSSMVWFPNNIPKHSFCAWLTVLGTHNIKDKLLEWGGITSNQCLFACGSPESASHLFFQCPLSQKVYFQNLMGLTNERLKLPQWSQWVSKTITRRNLHASLGS
ncbi:zf-RVT domain-containing protein [Cephalotus follicularis]|uniref:Zf-RVT domain-containing protein n=1 Tax=Cephalotus follicularis TaxID=3775 RepID=A0A1Q3BS22_CEPFO|nr:zf-RVT domain-containing protein [Cephalotus follicularis]